MQSTEDFRKEKAERINETVSHALVGTLRLLNQIDKHNRKRPRVLSKRNSHRTRYLHNRKHDILLAQIAIHRYLTDMQIRMILSQPYPKFKPGGVNNNETESTDAIGTIGETGPELINGPFVPNTNAIQSLPIGQRNNI